MFGFLKRGGGTDIEALKPRIASGEMTLVDVRGADELRASGSAKGAVNIPLVRLPMVADPRSPDSHAAVSPEKPIALYCASGARSAQAKRLLERMGYEEVHNLGGLNNWIRAGGEIKR